MSKLINLSHICLPKSLIATSLGLHKKLMAIEATLDRSAVTDNIDHLKVVHSALQDFLRQTSVEGAPTILYGSFGRRLSASGVENIGDYYPLALESSYFQPKVNSKGLMDLDLAIPGGDANWTSVARIAQSVMQDYREVEVDPHLLTLVQDSPHSNNFWLGTGGVLFPFETREIEIGNQKLQVFDPTTNLMMLLTSNKIRPSDLVEAVRLVQNDRTGSFLPGNDLKSALALALKSGKLVNVANLIRWPYSLLVPVEMRYKIAKLRGRSSGELNQLNAEKENPHYF